MTDFVASGEFVAVFLISGLVMTWMMIWSLWDEFTYRHETCVLCKRNLDAVRNRDLDEARKAWVLGEARLRMEAEKTNTQNATEGEHR